MPAKKYELLEIIGKLHEVARMLSWGGTPAAAVYSSIRRGHQIFAICPASDGDPLRDGSFVGCIIIRLFGNGCRN